MSHLKKRDRGHQRTKAKSSSKKNHKNYQIILTTCPPWYKSTTPHLFHCPIIYNNTIDIEFLVQMRQSNKCQSARNDGIFNLHFGLGADHCVGIPCLQQDTRHTYWFHLSKQLTRKKQRIQKWDSTPHKLHCTALAFKLPVI